jgi:hypothetical protein
MNPLSDEFRYSFEPRVHDQKTTTREKKNEIIHYNKEIFNHLNLCSHQKHLFKENSEKARINEIMLICTICQLCTALQKL